MRIGISFDICTSIGLGLQIRVPEDSSPETSRKEEEIARTHSTGRMAFGGLGKRGFPGLKKPFFSLTHKCIAVSIEEEERYS
jgi:hypothetical protein